MAFDHARAATLPFPGTGVHTTLRDLVQLTKPRITSLVVVTAGTGFCVASTAPLALVRLLHTLAGTWLVASAAAVFNQVYESDTDALMRRTCRRPLPAGRLDPDAATAFATVLGVAGLLELGIAVNVLAAGLALLTLVSYVAVYTPLKLRTPLALEIGAVPGALPPVIGWAAARGDLGFGALALFAILFFWQMPHFLAIAWMCRADYARAGFRVLSVVDEDGRRTARRTLFYTALLVLATGLPVAAGSVGLAYLAAATLAGLGLLALAVAFVRAPRGAHGRRLFLASLLYLPLVCALLVASWR